MTSFHSRIDSFYAQQQRNVFQSRFHVVWALMGLAMAATLYEPAFAAIVGWFASHRDRALLTLTLVAGLASTIFVPIETALLARMDWRTTLVTLAVFLAVTTIPVHAFEKLGSLSTARWNKSSARRRSSSLPLFE